MASKTHSCTITHHESYADLSYGHDVIGINYTGSVAAGTYDTTNNTYAHTSTVLKFASARIDSQFFYLTVLDQNGNIVAQGYTGSGHSTMGEQTIALTNVNLEKSIKLTRFRVELSDPQQKVGSSSAIRFGDLKVTFTVTYTETPKVSSLVINYPAADNRITYNQKPWFRVTLSGSGTFTYQYAIDSGAWKTISTKTAGTLDWSHDATLAFNNSSTNHTLHVKILQSNTTFSTLSRTFRVYQFDAAVRNVKQSTSIISALTISYLRSAANQIALYYNSNSTVTLPAAPAVGGLINAANLSSYASKLNGTPHISGLPTPTAGNVITFAFLSSYITKMQNG